MLVSAFACTDGGRSRWGMCTGVYSCTTKELESRSQRQYDGTIESRSGGQRSGTGSTGAANGLKMAVRGGGPESEAAAACECDDAQVPSSTEP